MRAGLAQNTHFSDLWGHCEYYDDLSTDSQYQYKLFSRPYL